MQVMAEYCIKIRGILLAPATPEILDGCPVLYADFAVLGRGRTTLSYVTGSVTTACCSNL
jgi:hypothetical protein